MSLYEYRGMTVGGAAFDVAEASPDSGVAADLGEPLTDINLREYGSPEARYAGEVPTADRVIEDAPVLGHLMLENL
ncbi:MAG TPA: hypothetical protein VK694_01985 [Verrucomicrobiae bacterium]|nr:hypothetical protein [Verrucomicrobiae bacterium]